MELQFRVCGRGEGGIFFSFHIALPLYVMPFFTLTHKGTTARDTMIVN